MSECRSLHRRRLCFQAFEQRCLLAAELTGAVSSDINHDGEQLFVIPPYEFHEPATPADKSQSNLVQSTVQLELDQFRNDQRFLGIDGSGFSVVVIDSGIDFDHPHFGPDSDGNGIADRIVYSQAFNGQATADDQNGHGTHVSATIASSDATHMGMAPAVDIISLQTQDANGVGSNFFTEQALQWTIANAAAYNITSVNMSIGDSQNYTEFVTANRLSDELAQLAAMDVIVVSASGNEYHGLQTDGVGYPAADINSLSVGSKRTTSNSISGFSQRDPELTTVFAPGDPIIAAWPGGGTRGLSGTSMASPHVAGIAVLMQQLATQELGRRLTPAEFEALLRSSSNDLVPIPGSSAFYPSMDVLALGEAVLSMKSSDVDLSSSNISVSAGLVRGQTGDVTLTVNNSGSAASGQFDVDVLLSANSIISSTGDHHLGTITVPNVPAGGSLSIQLSNFSIPVPNDPFWSASESYFIGAAVDLENVVGESNEANNLNVGLSIDKVAVSIDNPPSDLRGSFFALNQASAIRGQSLVIDYSVENIGTGPAYYGEVDFYLSDDSTIDSGGDLLLGTVDLGTVLASGDVGPLQYEIDLPENSDPFWLASSPYTIGMVVDPQGRESELDETNNANRGPALDLQTLQIEPPPTTVTGTIFFDDDNDGVRKDPFGGPVRFSRAAGDVIRPGITTTFDYQNLPFTSGNATLRVQANGDFNEAEEFATIDIDGLFSVNLFDEDYIGAGLIEVDETIDLEGAQWLQAIADGELAIDFSMTNPGSFGTGSTNYVRLTLEYDGQSNSHFYGAALSENRVLDQFDTDVSILAPDVPVGDATLTLVAAGDIGGLAETSTIDIEGMVSFDFFDMTSGSGDMSGEMGTATIPLATLQTILADGKLDANVSFSDSVDGFYPGNFFDLSIEYPIEVEAGVGGIEVQLDVDANGTFDQTVISQHDDPTTVFDETGMYEFSDIGFGDFNIGVVKPASVTLTTPVSGLHQVNLIDGESRSGLDFGLNGPRVVLSVDREEIDEGESATISATLSEASTQNVTIDLSFGGPASLGADYQVTPQITIAAGNLVGTTTLISEDDGVDESNESVSIAIENIIGALHSSAGPVDLVILDGALPRHVSLAIDQGQIAEGSGQAVLTATLSEIHDQSVTVNLAYSGEAILGVDYSRGGDNTQVIPSVEEIAVHQFDGDDAVRVNETLPSSGVAVLDFKTNGVSGSGYLLGHYNNGNRVYLFVTSTGDLYARITGGAAVLVANGVDDGQWHQVALVYGTVAEVGQARVYVDGVHAAEISNPTSTLNMNDHFHLGAVTTADGTSTQLHFTGEIRNFRAFNGVLPSFQGTQELVIPAGMLEASVNLYAREDSEQDTPEDLRVDIDSVEGAAEIGEEFVTSTIVGSGPFVESVVINDGQSGSRSAVTSLTVTFDTQIDPFVIGPAFSVRNLTTNETVQSLLMQVSVDSNGRSVINMTFGEGRSVVTRGAGNSLANGNYRLDVNAAFVQAASGGQTMEHDFAFGGATSDVGDVDRFFRFFGDSDGDRDVDGLDLGAFGLVFLKTSEDAAFRSDLDFDGDGDVDGLDLGAFGQQFLKTLN